MPTQRGYIIERRMYYSFPERKRAHHEVSGQESKVGMVRGPRPELLLAFLWDSRTGQAQQFRTD